MDHANVVFWMILNTKKGQVKKMTNRGYHVKKKIMLITNMLKCIVLKPVS